MDSLEIQVDVNESYIQPRDAGPTGGGDAERLSGLEDPGDVDRDHPTADRSKATVKVRIAIQWKDARIVPDMGARVGFLDGKPAARRAAARAQRAGARGLRAHRGRCRVVFVYASGKCRAPERDPRPDVSASAAS